MLKRSFDVVTAFTGLVIFSPILLAVALAIWLQDYGSPFYIAPRAARGGGFFEMIKFRSMVVNADKIGAPPRPLPTGALLLLDASSAPIKSTRSSNCGMFSGVT